MLLKRRIVFAFARTKGDAGVTCRLKIRLTTHHGTDFISQMMMPWITQPLPPETNIGAVVICAEKAILPISIRIHTAIPARSRCLGQACLIADYRAISQMIIGTI